MPRTPAARWEQGTRLKMAQLGRRRHRSRHLAKIISRIFASSHSAGQNAEAYFSADDRYLTFQHQGQFYDPQTHEAEGPNVPCDQMYTIIVQTFDKKVATPKLVSNGKGRTTCSYFFPSGDRMLYSSTFAANPACPPQPDYSQGYVWPIYNTYTIYTANADGSGTKPLTTAPGYNAESTITRDGKHIVFTSTRNGDLDIYTMNADGSHVQQLTHELGYDGGAVLVVRRQEDRVSRRASANAGADRGLQGAARARPDSSRQFGNLGDECGRLQQASGDAQRRREFRSLFSARRQAHHFRVQSGKHERSQRLRSLHHPRRRHRPGTHHHYPGFDAFPMFSSDGKRLVWASNRNGSAPHETNIFIADWAK